MYFREETHGQHDSQSWKLVGGQLVRKTQLCSQVSWLICINIDGIIASGATNLKCNNTQTNFQDAFYAHLHHNIIFWRSVRRRQT